MMNNNVDVNNEDSVQSYDQGSKYENTGNIGDQQQLSFTTEGATTSLRDYNDSENIHEEQQENITFSETAKSIVDNIYIPIPSLAKNKIFFENATQQFLTKIKKMKYYRCEQFVSVTSFGQPIVDGCKEGFFAKEYSMICTTCKRNENKIKAGQMTVRMFSYENGMDPFPCHKLNTLKDFPSSLTQIEEMIIALASPVMSVYRIRQNIKYRGHCVTIPQDVYEFARKLPLLPSEAPCIIVRRYSYKEHNEYKDFRVRKHIIAKALEWLTLNNVLYQNIMIDNKRLAQLPEDGFVSNDINTVIEDQKSNCVETSSIDYEENFLKNIDDESLDNMFNEAIKSNEKFDSVTSDIDSVDLALSDDNVFDLQPNLTEIVEAIEDEDVSFDNILHDFIGTEDIDLQSYITQNVETLEFQENNIDNIQKVDDVAYDVDDDDSFDYYFQNNNYNIDDKNDDENDELEYGRNIGPQQPVIGDRSEDDEVEYVSIIPENNEGNFDVKNHILMTIKEKLEIPDEDQDQIFKPNCKN